MTIETIFIGLILALLVFGVIIALSSNDDDDKPKFPPISGLGMAD